MEDHYFGTIKTKVSEFMKDLNEELWKLGILAKTEHNEVAPAQHELAPIFTTTNIASDHNQITMEMMKKVAERHNMACLLHEKPFDGVNGSGKHNNWSISTDLGVNLLEPGDSPKENLQFLLFLVAVIKAVDEYADLLRVSVASAGNDHRLGANEAPPAIVSMFVGDELGAILDSIVNATDYEQKDKEEMELGIHSLPKFFRDTTDRNRTSPFAFTGNKFEFRMLGSTVSVAGPNIILNTIVAEELSQFADEHENSQKFERSLHRLIKRVLKEHYRIIFNGNNYSDEWLAEAEKRGLYNLKTTADALPYFIKEKNIKMFEKHGIFTAAEVHSRYEIVLENYCKTLNIEALTMIDMARKQILPAVFEYTKTLTESAIAKKNLSKSINITAEESIVEELSELSSSLYLSVNKLEDDVDAVKNYADIQEEANYYRDVIIKDMTEVRKVADEIEFSVAKDYWPYPTYGELLFSVL